MTIKEKHLKILEEYYRFHHEYDCGYGAMGTDEAAALKDAIDTMRKYQKIQEIMKSKKMDTFNIGLLNPKDMAYVLHEIKEVVGDGNDGI